MRDVVVRRGRGALAAGRWVLGTAWVFGACGGPSGRDAGGSDTPDVVASDRATPVDVDAGGDDAGGGMDAGGVDAGGRDDARADTVHGSDVAAMPDARADAGAVTHGSQIDATNTGPSGSLASRSGTITLATDGAVLENFDLDGSIHVTADNVVIRNCRVHMSDGYFTIANDGRNLLIANCEIYSNTPSTAYTGVVGDNLTVRRCNIHDFENDIAVGSNVLVEENYLHGLAGVPSGHRDAIEWSSSGNDSTIRRNRFETGGDATSCLNVTPYSGGTAHNVTIEDNWFAGGGYSLYLRGDGGGTVDTVTVTGTIWAHGSFMYGPASVVSVTGLHASDNMLDDGTPVSL